MPVPVLAATIKEMKEGKGKRVRIGDEEISLWMANGKFYAIGNFCAHQHIPALHEGILDGSTVTCPMHGWAYELGTGKAVHGSGRVPVFDVVVRGEKIFVEVPESWVE